MDCAANGGVGVLEMMRMRGLCLLMCVKGCGVASCESLRGSSFGFFRRFLRTAQRARFRDSFVTVAVPCMNILRAGGGCQQTFRRYVVSESFSIDLTSIQSAKKKCIFKRVLLMTVEVMMLDL